MNFSYVVSISLFLSQFMRTASSDSSNRIDLDVRIVGGEETNINNLPYQVALLTLIRRGRLLHFAGGGSIINRDFVLTAGDLDDKCTFHI